MAAVELPLGKVAPDFPHAKCRRPPFGVDPRVWLEQWYPETGGGIRGYPPDSPAHRAIALCRLCPHLAECRAYADTSPVERYGIWGGESPWQRGQIRRRRTRAVA
jgi:hypothetical protein